MPVYDYKCPEHGLFSELAVLEHASAPAPCPICVTLSPRVIVMPPQVLDMAPEKRQAMATNERSRHAPVVSSQERRELDEEHRQGCGCQARKPGSKLFYTAEGDKMFPSMRPWMISH